MLKILRKKGVAKKILWVIAVVIVISFGFLGTAYLITDTSPRIGHAGKIFGKKIPLDAFNKSYRDVRIQAIIRYGEKFNEITRFLNLETETWDRLILLHEARKRKIKIADEDVVKTIQEYPFFQRNGQFDTLLYHDILRYVFRINPRDFEESIRDQITFAKLFEQETRSVSVSDEQVFEAFKTREEKVQVSYVFVSPEQFKNEITFTEEEAQQYYTDHKLEFLAPPTINVEYITLPFPEIPEEKTPDTEQPSEQQTGTDTGASSVEAAGPEGKEQPASKIDPEAEKEAVRQKAAEIFQELLVNPNMQETAPRYNLDVKESGFFSMEQPNLALGWSYDLLDEIFQLEPNIIHEPFEASGGIHIVKLKEKKDAFVPAHPGIKDKVHEAVLNSKAKGVAQKKAKEHLASIHEELSKTKVKDFAKAAKTLDLEIHQTPEFRRGQYLPKIGIAKEFQEAAFTLTEENDISGIVETTNGFCILHLDSYVPVSKEDFERERETLAESLLTQRRNEAFNDFLTSLRLAAKLEDYVSKQQAQNP